MRMLARACKILTTILRWQTQIFRTGTAARQKRSCSSELMRNGKATDTKSCLHKNNEKTDSTRHYLYTPGEFHSALNLVRQRERTDNDHNIQAEQASWNGKRRNTRGNYNDEEVRAKQYGDSFSNWSFRHIMGSSHNEPKTAQIPTRKTQRTDTNCKTKYRKCQTEIMKKT